MKWIFAVVCAGSSPPLARVYFPPMHRAPPDCDDTVAATNPALKNSSPTPKSRFRDGFISRGGALFSIRRLSRRRAAFIFHRARLAGKGVASARNYLAALFAPPADEFLKAN